MTASSESSAGILRSAAVVPVVVVVVVVVGVVVGVVVVGSVDAACVG